MLDPNSPVVSGDGKITVLPRRRLLGRRPDHSQPGRLYRPGLWHHLGRIPQANGFTFVDAVPTTIVLRGTGVAAATVQSPPRFPSKS